MLDISITEARSRLAERVRQAEGGQPVRITRRGRAVAVLMSSSGYTRLSTGRVGLLAYTRAWRAQVAHSGLSTWCGIDGADLRDQSERPAPDLA